MITETFINMLHGLAVALFAWLSVALPDAPSFWADGTAAMETLIGSLSEPVRYFLPITAAISLGLTFTGLIVTLGLIRLARRVVSLFTGGGGMA